MNTDSDKEVKVEDNTVKEETVIDLVKLMFVHKQYTSISAFTEELNGLLMSKNTDFNDDEEEDE